MALLGTMAVSCQKEDFDNCRVSTEENAAVYTVTYVVDGIESTVTLVGETAWSDFLNRMLALSEEGHSVAFRLNTGLRQGLTKEQVTFTTTDHDAAYEWAEKKVKEGYEVYVYFDDNTKVYTCIAIR